MHDSDSHEVAIQRERAKRKGTGWILIVIGVLIGMRGGFNAMTKRDSAVEDESLRGPTKAILSAVVPIALVIAGIYYLESKPKAADGSRSRDASDEPPPSGPQLAGNPCIHCREKIVSHLGAAMCKVCKQPVHLDCRKDHRADAHPKQSYQQA